MNTPEIESRLRKVENAQAVMDSKVDNIEKLLSEIISQIKELGESLRKDMQSNYVHRLEFESLKSKVNWIVGVAAAAGSTIGLTLLFSALDKLIT